MIFRTKIFSLTIGKDSVVQSLAEHVTQQNLLAEPAPFCEAELLDGSIIKSNQFEPHGAVNHICFEGKSGDFLLKIRQEEEYLVFETEQVNIPGLKALRFCNLRPMPKKYVGKMLGMLSDDEFCVCLRSLDFESKTIVQPDKLAVQTFRMDGSFSGCKALLVACPRSKIMQALQTLTKKEDVPYSPCGGAWALQGGRNRQSYMMAAIYGKDIDRWIRMVKRGGFGILHLYAWWNHWGDYTPAAKYFPGGQAELKQCFEKIHAAGLLGGLHMLSACIEPEVKWVSPVPSPNLAHWTRYHLSRDVGPLDTEIPVDRIPEKEHDFVWTYSGNGNVLRIGNELIQYSGLSREIPYRFTGCTRGAFNTISSPHAAGNEVDYLRQRYMAFYPEAGSRLFYDMLDEIAAIYHDIHADMIYMDGAEGIGDRNAADFFRWEMMKRQETLLLQTSDSSPGIWWINSGFGAWDVPGYAPKDFIDMHVRTVKDYPKSDLMPAQLGWWAFCGASADLRGQMTDAAEYFGAKSLAFDAPLSAWGISPNYNDHHDNARVPDMLTLLGWYQKLRMARYFEPESIRMIGEPKRNFRLRLNDDGEWKLREVKSQMKRLNAAQKWTLNNPNDDQPLKLRLESLYSAAERDPFTIADFSEGNVAANGNVRREINSSEPDPDGGIRHTRMIAENPSDTSRGAWVQIAREYPYPYFDIKDSQSVSVWVKGDGSGALMNFQLHCPREFGLLCADHYIDLDFTGWKKIELFLRERDTARFHDYVWPYDEWQGNHAIYGSKVDRKHVDQISVYLNAIPAHGKVDVQFGPFIGHPLCDTDVLKKTVLVVNGETVVLPVVLHCSEYLELEDGHGSCYDEHGFLISDFEIPVPMIRHGENTIEFHPGSKGRSELTLYTHGSEFGKISPAFNAKELDEDCELAAGILHGKAERTFYLRKGTVAQLDCELSLESSEVPVTDIEFILDGIVYSFPNAVLTPETILLFGEGDAWSCVDKHYQELKSGKLSAPVPQLHGVKHKMEIRFQGGGKHLAFLNVVKKYNQD